jgi:hypothetical protein
MVKLSANLKATFDRAFPDRQIYHRSGGTVRYISVSPWQQAIMAAGVTALAGWTVTDAQGRSTRVELKDFRKVSGLPASLFIIKDPRPQAPGRGKM